jgi:hypothetical protein
LCPIFQLFHPTEITVPNFMWVLRMVCLMIKKSLWHQTEYFQLNSSETSCLDSSVVQVLDSLPDFAHKLSLSDKLRDRQTGIITKRDGYIAPKTKLIPRIMEAIEVEKKVKAKARCAPRP